MPCISPSTTGVLSTNSDPENRSTVFDHLPKNLPQICSLLVGYFSYDIIRYIEKIPDKCKDDLKIPDIRLLRPKTIIN